MRIIHSNHARRTVLCLLVAAGLLMIAGCDSSGPIEPNWLGDWEVTNAASETYWLLTKDEGLTRSFSLETRTFSDGVCEANMYEVATIEGDVVEFNSVGETDGSMTVRFDGSGSEITATIIEPDGGQAKGEELSLRAVNSVPACN